MAPAIFISHSSEDAAIVEAMVDLFQYAFYYLLSEDIGCTDIPRFTLPASADVHTWLQGEVREPKVFIGLITPASLASLHVAFELGARWETGQNLILVLASGISPAILRAPLSELPVVDCAEEEDVMQLVNWVAQGIQIQPERAYVYQSAIHRLMEASECAAKRHMPN